MAITKIVKAPLTISGGKHLNCASPNWRVEMTFRFTAAPGKVILQENICSTGKWQVYYESGKIHTYLYYYDGSRTYSKTYSFSCGTLSANVPYTLSLTGSYSNKTIAVSCNGVSNKFTGAATGWSAVSKIRSVVIGSSNMELMNQIIVAGNTGGKTSSSGQCSITIPIESATAGYKTVSGTNSEISTTYTIIPLSQSITSSTTVLTATESINSSGGKSYSISAWPYVLSNYDSSYSYILTLSVPDAGIEQQIDNPANTGSIILSDVQKLYTATLNKEYKATLSVVTKKDNSQIGVTSTINATIKLSEDYSQLGQVKLYWYSQEVEYSSGKHFLRSAEQTTTSDTDAPSYIHPKGINYKSFYVTGFTNYLPTLPSTAKWNVKMSGYPSTIWKEYNDEVKGYITLDRISSTTTSAAILTFTSPRTGASKAIAKSAPKLVMYQPIAWQSQQPTFTLQTNKDTNETVISWTPSGVFSDGSLINVNQNSYWYNQGMSESSTSNIKKDSNSLIGAVKIGDAIIPSDQTSYNVAQMNSPYSITWAFNDELGQQLGIPDTLTGQQVLIVTANGIEFRKDSTGVSFGGPAPGKDIALFHWDLRTVDEKGNTLSLSKRITGDAIEKLFTQGGS